VAFQRGESGSFDIFGPYLIENEYEMKRKVQEGSILERALDGAFSDAEYSLMPGMYLR
jgi:hypothetical protein